MSYVDRSVAISESILLLAWSPADMVSDSIAKIRTGVLDQVMAMADEFIPDGEARLVLTWSQRMKINPAPMRLGIPDDWTP